MSIMNHSIMGQWELIKCSLTVTACMRGGFDIVTFESQGQLQYCGFITNYLFICFTYAYLLLIYYLQSLKPPQLILFIKSITLSFRHGVNKDV